MDDRQKMIERDAKERSKDFKEVVLGFDEELAVKEAKRCLLCKNPLCMKGCPVNVQIPDFIKKVKERDFEGAINKIKETNNLPAICGRVCPQENQCEGKCIRGIKGSPISIGALERFCADWSLKNKKVNRQQPQKNQYKVAIIGSGPAGLSCASDLALEGVNVTVFEAFHKLGGVLTYGIPEFRLPKSLVQTEIDNLKELGIKFEKNVVIGKTLFVDELLQEYDAVFIGSGAGLPIFLNIEGEGLNGVYSANEILTRINLMGAYKVESETPVYKGKKVVVIGAGNVAMDSARTILRLGAEDVTIVYRRGRQEMPARKAEIEHAEEEGINFELLANPTKINGENGWVKSITCVKMQLTEPDESGRRKSVEIKGSEFDIACDMVIVALGTTPNPLLKQTLPNLEVTPKGTVLVDENMMTSIKGIFAGGDAVTGAATVILAMGAGKKAATGIINYIKSK